MKNSLGIIGGVGPLASCYLYELITKNTKASKDQEHLNIVILSHSTIPDRTAYILGKSKENPYPYLLEDCKTLEKMGCKMIVIPCNTSCYFNKSLQENINIPVNNMVADTAKYVYNKGFKKVAILATTGTIMSKLYQNELDKYNIKYTLANQDKVMSLIYDYVKAGIDVPSDLWNDVIKDLDVDAYILGCTELSVIKKNLKLSSKFIDPLEIETSIVLDFFGKERKM